MNKDELKKLIDEKTDSLKKPFDYGEMYEYHKSFVENNRYDSLKDFLDIDTYKCAACVYATKDEESTVEDCEKHIEVLKGLLNSLDCYEIHHYRTMLIAICLSFEIKNFKGYLTADEDEKEEILNKMKKRIADNDVIDTLMGIDEKDYPKFYYLAEKIQKYPYEAVDGVALIEAQKALKHDYFDYISNKEKSNKLPDEKTTNKFFLLRGVKEKYNQSAINKMIKCISNYIILKEQQAKKHDRNVKREIDSLNSAFELLGKQLEKAEITNIDTIVDQVKDENIKFAFLQVIYSHNLEYYNSLENEIRVLEENSEIQYQALLNEFGINKSEYDVELIMINSIKDVREMLEFLSKLNISNKDKLSVLNKSDLETVNTIKTHVNIGYLTIDFISTNIDLLISNSNKYNNYIKNICELNKYNINPNVFVNSLDILISDDKLISKNLEILNKYNLFATFKDANNYNFLLEANLEEKIDKILELGYESFLELDLNTLNSESINRLELMKALNYPINSKEEFDKIIDSSKSFFVDDDNIDSYIPSVVSLKEKKALSVNTKDLEKYRSSLRVYRINDTLVSVNKVNRLLGDGYDMYDAILYNMNLSNDEYENVISTLTPKTYHI